MRRTSPAYPPTTRLLKERTAVAVIVIAVTDGGDIDADEDFV